MGALVETRRGIKALQALAGVVRKKYREAIVPAVRSIVGVEI